MSLGMGLSESGNTGSSVPLVHCLGVSFVSTQVHPSGPRPAHRTSTWPPSPSSSVKGLEGLEGLGGNGGTTEELRRNFRHKILTPRVIYVGKEEGSNPD